MSKICRTGVQNVKNVTGDWLLAGAIGKRLCSATIQSVGVELTGGVLSRPVSPKLAQQAVWAKPPYFMLNDSLKSPDGSADDIPQARD